MFYLDEVITWYFCCFTAEVAVHLGGVVMDGSDSEGIGFIGGDYDEVAIGLQFATESVDGFRSIGFMVRGVILECGVE